MKYFKKSNFLKLTAFLIIATMLTFAVTFAANGWQPIINHENSGNADQNNDVLDSETDNNTKPDKDENDIPAVTPIPEFLNAITGLQTTRENSLIRPISFVMSSDAPLYGISSSLLTVEVPIEDGTTRFIVTAENSHNLGKIGSIAPSRKFINTFISHFNSIIMSYGVDDSFEYGSAVKIDSTLDFTAVPGYHYTEFSNFIYTNGDLVNAFINNSGVNITAPNKTVMPYDFNGYNSELLKGNSPANQVSVKFSEGNSTELIFSKDNGKYILSKNGTVKNDSLNDKSSFYDNVFVLFANSTTYETSESTESVLDTVGGGDGYYITNGTKFNIKWKNDESGNLVFLNDKGEKLTINRGISYIGFAKASKTDNVVIA